MTEHQSSQSEKASRFKQYGLAAMFGLVFGFLLQKGGVAKFHILVGALLLQDFTVFKVMISAIIVGMFGVFALRAMGKLELQTKTTRLGANIIGGLVFGFGFACSGYCPGTGAAALGQNNWDALFMIAGMIAGSYAYAMSSASITKTINHWGERGKLMLPQLIGARLTPFVIVFGLVLIAGLALLEYFDAR